MKLPDIKRNSRMQILVPVIAFVIVVIIVLLIVIPTAPKEPVFSSAEAGGLKQETEEVMDITELISTKAETAEPKESSDSAVNDFFRKYYQAMADGDAASMEKMFDQPGHAVTSEALSTLIESYDNIRVYTAEGLHDGETAAFVYSDVKFNNIETPAPSVESFYLLTGNGDPVIMSDMYTDENIAEYLTKLSKKNPVKSIMENTDFWLDTTLKNDEALQEIYNKMKEYASSAD